MTPRKLFILLSLLATLITGVTWWMSFRTWYSFSAAVPPHSFAAHLSSGTVSLVWDPRRGSHHPPQVRTFPVRRSPQGLTDLMGKFNFRAGGTWHLAFPIWLPGLVLVSAGAALLFFHKKPPVPEPPDLTEP